MENFVSAANFALRTVAGDPVSGPGLPPSLHQLPRPRRHRVQLPPVVLLVPEVHQAEITPRLVAANHAEGTAGHREPCEESGKTRELILGAPRSRAGASTGCRGRAATGWQQNPSSGEAQPAAAWDRAWGG